LVVLILGLPNPNAHFSETVGEAHSMGVSRAKEEAFFVRMMDARLEMIEVIEEVLHLAESIGEVSIDVAPPVWCRQR
jgi:hypothetical protein